MVIQTEYIDDGEDEEADQEMKDGGDGDEDEDGEEDKEDCEMKLNPDGDAEEEQVSEVFDFPLLSFADRLSFPSFVQPQLNPKARLASKKASEAWSTLLRSKGFIWLATRPLMFGEWSQAGVMLTISGGGRWRCESDQSQWEDDPEMKAAIEADMQGQWGDRRQEVVMIGTEMRKGKEEKLRAVLDGCLLVRKSKCRR